MPLEDDAAEHAATTLAPAAQARRATTERAAGAPRAVTCAQTVACAEKDVEGERRFQVGQARGLMQSMLGHLTIVERAAFDKRPEAVANQLGSYLAGWADTLTHAAPELAGPLSAEIETVMCDSGANPSALIVMARAMRRLPELGSERALDCVITRGGEDIVLWEALETWRQSPLPKTAAIERLEHSATDERTRRRLVRAADEAATAALPEDFDTAYAAARARAGSTIGLEPEAEPSTRPERAEARPQGEP